MQILYVEKLQSLWYEQHIYAIIGKKCTCVKKCFQYIFINVSTPNLHCTIYDSHMPMTKKLPGNTIQLLCTYKCELVTYIYKCNVANRQLIMWCIHNSICNKHCVWFYLKKSQYVLTQMWTHLQNSINNRYIFPFPKCELIWHIYITIHRHQ
jgi:hypothetical protein